MIGMPRRGCCAESPDKQQTTKEEEDNFDNMEDSLESN
jgi:hypothetical protein